MGVGVEAAPAGCPPDCRGDPWVAHPDSPRGCVEEGQTQGSAPAGCPPDCRGDPWVAHPEDSPALRKSVPVDADPSVAGRRRPW